MIRRTAAFPASRSPRGPAARASVRLIRSSRVGSPGSSRRPAGATPVTLAAPPAAASSSATHPPRELPATCGRSTPRSASTPANPAASAGHPASACGGRGADRPWPGRSTATMSKRAASGVSTGAQTSRAAPTPWTSTSVGASSGWRPVRVSAQPPTTAVGGPVSSASSACRLTTGSRDLGGAAARDAEELVERRREDGAGVPRGRPDLVVPGEVDVDERLDRGRGGRPGRLRRWRTRSPRGRSRGRPGRAGRRRAGRRPWPCRPGAPRTSGRAAADGRPARRRRGRRRRASWRSAPR